MKFRATQSAPASSTKTASSRLSQLKIGRLWVGATTWTRWRRCPHLPSGLNPTLDAHDWRRRRFCLDRRSRRRALLLVVVGDEAIVGGLEIDDAFDDAVFEVPLG